MANLNLLPSNTQSDGAWASAVPTSIKTTAGTAAAWGVVRFVMRADWVFLPGTLALTVLACMAITLGFGYAGTAFALRAKAAPLLRNE